MKGKPNIITCRFNNPLINKVRSKIEIVTPNYNWNFIWQKRHVHIIAINLRKPTHTHATVCLGGCASGTDVKISIVHSYPNKPACMVIPYTMPKTDITDTYFLSLALSRQVLAHTVLDTIVCIYIYTHILLECRNVTVYRCVCVIHKHPRVHARFLLAKGEEPSPVKRLASLTIFKIIMGASAI